MSEFFTTSDGRRFIPEPAPTMRRGWVDRNFVRSGMSRPTQIGAPIRIQGLPDTTKFVNADRVPLTRALQEFWFALLRRDAPHLSLAEHKSAWRSLTHGGRAFTNGKGWNNGYADYISGVNTNAEPMSMEPIITVGLVELLGDPLHIPGAGECWPVKVLRANAAHSAETINQSTHREVIFRAVVSRREGYNEMKGEWAREDLSIPFPQLGGADVPVPMLSRDTGDGPRYGLPVPSPFTVNYIAADRIRELPAETAVPATYIF